MKNYEEVQKWLTEHTIVKKNLYYLEEQKERFNIQREALSEKNKNISLLLFDVNDTSDKVNVPSPKEAAEKRWSALEKSPLNTENPWDTDTILILEAFFGRENAPYVACAWMKRAKLMYQNGYYRRSFRAPNRKDLYFKVQVQWLQSLWENWKYDIPLVEYASMGNYISGDFSLVIAAALEMQHPGMFERFQDIINGDAEKGAVNSQIIKALLLTDTEPCWELVKKLLLAAQRQEGLRQVIFESLDACSIGAMKYFLKLVMDENLLRFSSVVRALDVWTGLVWEGQRAAAVKRCWTYGLQYLMAPETIESAMTSKDNMEIYMALWAQGVYDVEQCYPYLEKLTKVNLEKRILAFYFANQTELNDANNTLLHPFLDSDEPWDIYWLNQMINTESDFEAIHPRFIKWLKLINKKSIPLKNKTFEWFDPELKAAEVANNWIRVANDKSENLEKILPFYLELPLEARESMCRIVLDGFSPYGYEKKKVTSTTPLQKELAYLAISDRGEYIQGFAINFFSQIELQQNEINLVEENLRKKGTNLRKSLLELLIKLPDESLLPTVERLATSKLKEQRLAGLDLLKQLKDKNRQVNWVRKIAETYQAANKISEKESLLLDNILSQNILFTKENGWGLYDVNALTPARLPERDANNPFYQRFRDAEKPYHWFSQPIEAIKKHLQDLDALISANKDYEYETETYDGGKEKYLLGNSFYPFKRNFNLADIGQDAYLNNYPLTNLWLEWFQGSGMDVLDLKYLTEQPYRYRWRNDQKDEEPAWHKALAKKYFTPYFIEKKEVGTLDGFDFPDTIENIIELLYKCTVTSEVRTYYLEAVLDMCYTVKNADIEDITVEFRTMENYYRCYNFSHQEVFEFYYSNLRTDVLDRANKQRLYQLKHWLHRSKLSKNPTIQNLAYFYSDCPWLNMNDHLEYAFDAQNVRSYTYRRKAPKSEYTQLQADYPKFAQSGIMEKAIDRVLEIEFARGESDTGVSAIAQNIYYFEGIPNFITCLKALGKDKLASSYYATSKASMMSHLLKHCFPAPTDTQDAFNKQVKEVGFDEVRLVEVAIYAPNWQEFIQKYLGWEGLESGIWWLHAHSSNTINDQKESFIARYSTLNMEDFNRGGVDVDWFKSVYAILGKKRWEILYGAAKYIAEGNGHTLAKLYADVILKNVKITEVTKRVKEKRNQNYLRVYGLVPLSKTVPQGDMLKRYEYLQQFLKESKQFGSQRQASESEAVVVALDNLARNAGYADPIRLTWAMESLQAQSLLEQAQELHFDDTRLWLEIDENGQASVLCEKKGKPLKNIPAKLKKEKAVEQLKMFEKKLKEQYRRTRLSLEKAMVNQDAFLYKELKDLFKHPVLKPMLTKLLFKSGNKVGIWSEDSLWHVREGKVTIAETEEIYVAHCTDIFSDGHWSAWQQHFFKQEIKQPFKQVFRELYLPTEDELKAETSSKRYAGHQIQPKKTVALLKSRGWTVDYESGLQKIYHKFNLRVELYAMADWFSPADVESPTLETVRFFKTSDYKNPLQMKDIPSFVFSEVMRDVDLVVSVAHVGGVDPEASLSTIALRKVIAEESARLYKLDNVTFKERHALIQGKYAQYSLHLGSGVVHVQPGGYVSIIPVHSQHRGRIFLPFVDEDPKTAEIISKMLLLARDIEIQDPTILNQLTGMLV